jgi:segregation and condensation protein A
MSDFNVNNFESTVDYTTVLTNFEGPLDLLLYLVKSNRIEIKDIFVSQVVEQYMNYMKGLPYLDAEKAAEYLVIATTILSIKAKSLVPDEEEEENDDAYFSNDGDDEEEDEGAKLIRALEEYRLIKEETPKLKEMETVGFFYKPPDKGVGKVRVVYKDFTLDKLAQVYAELMLRAELNPTEEEDIKEIPQDSFTVSEKIGYIREYLSENEKAEFRELLAKKFNKAEAITTFQALLELIKHQYVCVKQAAIYDPIYITLNPERNEEEDFGQLDEYN